MSMKTMTTVKLEIGKDIILAKGEKLLTYKNKITGEIVYSTSKYTHVWADGKEFIMVFRKPAVPNGRRVNLMAADSLERVRV